MSNYDRVGCFSIGLLTVALLLAIDGVEELARRHTMPGLPFTLVGTAIAVILIGHIVLAARGRSRLITEQLAIILIALTAIGAIYSVHWQVVSWFHQKQSQTLLIALSLLVGIPLLAYLVLQACLYGMEQWLKTPREHLRDWLDRDD